MTSDNGGGGEQVVEGREIRLPKKAEKVKNKAIAPVQITAEQLLMEAKSREFKTTSTAPRLRITDPEEKAEDRRHKRKDFEDGIRKNGRQIANWVKYAKFEERIGDLGRVRSVFERALDVDPYPLLSGCSTPRWR